MRNTEKGKKEKLKNIKIRASEERKKNSQRPRGDNTVPENKTRRKGRDREKGTEGKLDQGEGHFYSYKQRHSVPCPVTRRSHDNTGNIS